MLPKWSNLKPEVLQQRKNGVSMTSLSDAFKIPKSTLSGWFKEIKLTPGQQKKLLDNKLLSLEKARTQASLVHRKNKKNRIDKIGTDTDMFLSQLNLQDKNVQELCLAMLYLGEGFKKRLGMGNSNPLILNFFIQILVENFKIKRNQIKCELHLRADQNAQKMKKFWSKELRLPLTCFTYVTFDMRTQKSATWVDYKGVCAIMFGDVRIQRRLTQIANKYCQRIIENGRLAQR